MRVGDFGGKDLCICWVSVMRLTMEGLGTGWMHGSFGGWIGAWTFGERLCRFVVLEDHVGIMGGQRRVML